MGRRPVRFPVRLAWMNKIHGVHEHTAILVGVVLGTIFLTEFAVMLVLDLLKLRHAPWIVALIDSMALSLTVSGVILWAIAGSRPRTRDGEWHVASLPGHDAPLIAEARPWEMFGLLLGAIFVTNAIVMLLIGLAPMGEHGWQVALIHAAGSTVPIAGAIWWLVLSPIRSVSSQAHRTATALASAEARLALALEGSGIAVWNADARTGAVWLSEQWEMMLGGERRETRTTVKDLVQLMHPDDRQRVLDAAAKVVKGGPNTGQYYSQEHRVRARDGGWRWIVSSGQVIDRTAAGRVLRMSGTNLDITVRKVAEQAHLESESRNRAVIEAALDAIIINDSQGRITEFNPSAERTFGYRSEDVIGRSLDETIIPERFRHVLSDDLASGNQQFEGRRAEVIAMHADGHEFPIDLTVQRVDRGGEWFFTTFARDISKRKRAEEALKLANTRLEQKNRLLDEASHAKTEFLAAVSHELRTPLNGVIGFADLLQTGAAGALDLQQAECVAEIRASGEKLLDLVNGVLEMTQVDSGEFLHNIEAVNLGNALTEVALAHRAEAAKRGIEIGVEVAADTGSIRINARALRRMIGPLLSNAIKFNREGGRVTLGAKRASGGRAVEIAVVDTGIGIAREDLKRLFQPFVQLDASLARRYGGVGIGLALVRRVAVACGGSVGVESEPGVGSVFTLRLPTRCEALEAGAGMAKATKPA
jgi:PAS domain S-box-containing protein